MQNEFVGKTFHRLVVMDVVPFGEKALRLRCQCTCGKEVLAKPHQLRSREKTSCGCWKREVLGTTTRTHGQSNSRITGYKSRAYGIWQAMRDRCGNPNRADYYRYGGRGITVCRRWAKFENFLADMGEPPEGLTLDRIDNDKGYSPHNCRWASRKQQTHNSTTLLYITLNGTTKHLADWCRVLGLGKATYFSRRQRGWSVEQALTTPVRRSNEQSQTTKTDHSGAQHLQDRGTKASA